MHARAPGSSANLGPGFDALAVAVELYVDVCVEPAGRLVVTSRGEGEDLPADATHLAARVATQVAGTDRLAIDVRSDIPVGRGLGSSAALAVAAAAAAGDPDPMRWGVAVDGHAENAAASAYGGLVAVATVGADTVVRPLPLDDDLRFVVIVPDRPLATAAARAVLAPTVAHTDAVFNLGRMALLIAGLADSHRLVAAATEDRLHQEARSALFPEATELLEGLLGAGALASCWSGAGPSLLAITDAGRATALGARAERLLEAHHLAGRVHVLAADRGGVVVDPS